MKGKRYITSADLPHLKDHDGKPLCRWCKGPVKPPRRSWCSDPCVKEYLLRSSPDALRRAVFARDKGVCASCGVDTEQLRRVFDYARKSYEALTRGRIEIKTWYDWPGHVIWLVFTAIGFNRDSSNTLWEADHIKEVCNGGESTLDNMQTLCRPCHKAKTKRMHAELAQQRRDAKRGLLETTTV